MWPNQTIVTTKLRITRTIAATIKIYHEKAPKGNPPLEYNITYIAKDVMGCRWRREPLTVDKTGTKDQQKSPSLENT